MKASSLLFSLLITIQSFGQCDCPSDLNNELELGNFKICSDDIFSIDDSKCIVNRFRIYLKESCTIALEKIDEPQTQFNFYLTDSCLLIEENILLPCIFPKTETEPENWIDRAGRCAYSRKNFCIDLSSANIKESFPTHDFSIEPYSLSVLKSTFMKEVEHFWLLEKEQIDSLKMLGITQFNSDIVYYGLLVGVMTEDSELIHYFNNFDSLIPNEARSDKHELIMKNIKYAADNLKEK